METAQKKILITGANGFVGSRLCARFASNGYQVIAGVRKNANLHLLEGVTVEYRYGDITQPDTLPAMVADVDFIIHNAGIVKAKSHDRFYDVNVKGTTNLLDAVLEHNLNLDKFILISSLAAIGPSVNGQAVKELDEPHPVSNYGKSKLAGEQAAMRYADRLNIIAIRPPGVYGPGDTEIFSLFQSAHLRLKPMIGSQRRKLHLVHVDDLCRGIQLALEAATKTGEAFFVGEDRAYSMAELAKILKAAVGRSAIPVIIPASIFRLIAAVVEIIMKLTGGIPMLTRDKAEELLCSFEMDGSKAKEIFGYQSEIPLAEGLKTTYQWYLDKGWLK